MSMGNSYSVALIYRLVTASLGNLYNLVLRYETDMSQATKLGLRNPIAGTDHLGAVTEKSIIV